MRRFIVIFLCLLSFVLPLFAAPTGLSPTTAESPFELLTAAQKDYLYVKTFEERRKLADDKSDTYDTLFCYGSPVELTWKDTTGTCTINVKRMADSKVVWTGTTDGLSVTVYNLELGADYEWTVTDSTGASSARFTTSAQTPRLIRTGLVRNLRDLGGWTGTLGGKQYRIRQNLLFRGGAVDDPKWQEQGTPAYLIENDSDRDFLCDVVGLKNEVDLRDKNTSSDWADRNSVNYKFDPTGEHVTYNNYSIANNALPTSGNIVSVWRLLMTPAKLPAYFHCKSGRDRTGIVAAVLLAVLGVSREDIVLDFQTTSDKDNWTTYGFDTILDSTLVKYMSADLTLAENTRAYLLACGITDGQIETFRETMLEGYVAGDAVPAKFCVTPYLQRPATDAMSILFFTDRECDATVECQLHDAAGTPRLQKTTHGVWAAALTNNLNAAAKDVDTYHNSLYRHSVRFEGLELNRIYDYTVTLPGGATYSNTLRTAPDRNTPIRFVSYADPETMPPGHASYTTTCRNNFTQNLKTMKGRDPDLIACSGDLAGRGGIQSHWDEFWKQNAGGTDAGYGDILGSIPFLNAIGNHDLFDNGVSGHSESHWYYDMQGEPSTDRYLSYFEVESNGVDFANAPAPHAETRDMSQLFHRKDFGPVTLIFLDTNNGRDGDTDDDHDHDTNYKKDDGDTQHVIGGLDRRKGCRHPDFNVGTPQYIWLTNNLADAQMKSRFTFVFNHHCPYSRGAHNKSWTTGEDGSALALRFLTETFVRYGVDGWYCGHDEMLEHSITNGWEVLPDGSRRKHTLSIYDLGCSGDTVRKSEAVSNPLEYYYNSSNYDGTGHYGFLETDVTTNRNGKWTCTITPRSGATGAAMSARVVYVEDPERGESENDLVFAQVSNAKNPIDGATVASDLPDWWNEWAKPPEGPAVQPPPPYERVKPFVRATWSQGEMNYRRVEE